MGLGRLPSNPKQDARGGDTAISAPLIDALNVAQDVIFGQHESSGVQ